MNYTPPEDINVQILTQICSRHHAFSAYRSQNCDKITIFDFILRKLRGDAKKGGCLFFSDLVHHENVVHHTFVGFC